MTINESDQLLITFRKRKFYNLLNELERCVNGQNSLVYPYITNQKGIYSERKTIQLVNHIVKGLDTSNKNLHNFYKSLFYCAIRAVTTPYEVYENGNIMGLLENPDNIDTTFSNLISFIHTEDLYLNEGVYRIPVDSTLATVITSLYQILSGKKAEKTDVLYGSFISHYEDVSIEYVEPIPEHIDDAEETHENILDEYVKLQELENLRIKKSFPSSVEYCKQFEILISQFDQNFQFEIFNNHIQIMIESFLTDQEVTTYNDTNSYLRLCTYLKKTIEMVNQI